MAQAHGAFLEMLLEDADREDDQPFGSLRAVRPADAESRPRPPDARPVRHPGATLEPRYRGDEEPPPPPAEAEPEPDAAAIRGPQASAATLGRRRRARGQPRHVPGPEGQVVSITVWGPVAKLGDVGAKYDRYGRIAEAYTFDEFELELPGDSRSPSTTTPTSRSESSGTPSPASTPAIGGKRSNRSETSLPLVDSPLAKWASMCQATHACQPFRPVRW